MNKSRYPWSGVLMLAMAVTACGVQPRPAKGKNPDLQASPEKVLPAPEKDGHSAGSFEVAGFRWIIRGAKKSVSVHPRSVWQFGVELPFQGVVSGDTAAFTEPLAWPDDPDSILMVQIRGDAAGDWTARCVMADGSVDETFAPHRIEWDPNSQSGLIPLHEVFGRRGQLRDPATVCTIQVRLDSRHGGSTPQLSLRVLGGLPAPEPAERKDHGWNVGGLLREEVWKNDGFRSLILQISAPSTVSILSKLRPAHLATDGESFRSIAEGVHVEARVILESTVSDWRALPLQLRWPAGSSIRVEYRLAPGRGTRVCEPMYHARVSMVVVHIPLRVHSRQFSGAVNWQVIVSEDGAITSEAVPRKSSRQEIQRGDDVLGIPAGSSPFDCQGWVP
jgi:hypothetical protein